MKPFFIALGTMLLLATASDSYAAACAKGVYRAGCAGPNGAVVVRKPPMAVAPAPAYRHGCTWVNGRKVCR